MSIPLSIRQFSQAGQVEDSDLSSTVFSQVYLDRAKVDRLARKSPDELPASFAARVGSKTIIMDGHHRSAADIKKGRAKTKVRVF